MAANREGILWRQTIRASWRTYEIPLISAMAALAYVLGCWGYAEYFRRTGETASVFEILYRSVRLFALNGDPFEKPIPWPLELSRFMAPAAMALTAIAALSEILRHQFRILGIRVRRPHVVVCGLGRKGLQLVRDLQVTKRVVVVEYDAQNELIDLCRDLGAVVLVGDATQVDILRQARVHRADQVFASSGDDSVNVEIAVHVYELHKAQPDEKRRKLKCHLHIVDPMLCTALKSHGMFRDVGSEMEVGVTNIFENSARILLEEHPLDREFIGAGDPRSVHLVVVGFGKMGQSVALQAARIGHFANGKKLRLTIVDRQADARRRSFLARYPQFASVCDVEFIPSEFETNEFFGQLRKWSEASETLLSVAICLDDASASLKCALALAAQLERTAVPLFVRMDEEAGLAALLKCRHESTQLLHNVCAFGQIDLAASLSKWTSPEQDNVAKVAHERFRKLRAAEGRPATDPSMRDWEDLDEGLKDSNRQFADHIAVKLRAIRCDIADGPTSGTGEAVTHFTEAEADLLAKMEHARWNAERFLAGWRLGPSDKRNKISPYLVDWEALPSEIKKYDYQLNALIPELAGAMNRRIYRTVGSPPAGDPAHTGCRP